MVQDLEEFRQRLIGHAKLASTRAPKIESKASTNTSLVQAFLAMCPIRTAFVAALLLSPSAHAALPHYDVDGYCTQVASAGGALSDSIKETCVAQEQEAYDALKPQWDGLPSHMRSYCDPIARSGGAGSYTILKTCIEQEQQAAGSAKPFQY